MLLHWTWVSEICLLLVSPWEISKGHLEFENCSKWDEVREEVWLSWPCGSQQEQPVTACPDAGAEPVASTFQWHSHLSTWLLKLWNLKEFIFIWDFLSLPTAWPQSSPHKQSQAWRHWEFKHKLSSSSEWWLWLMPEWQEGHVSSCWAASNLRKHSCLTLSWKK